jgi:IS1 family transposase
MNRLPLSKRAQLLGLLTEGNSLRATSRLADVSFNTVLKFVVDMGRACSDYQDKALRNLKCKRLQVDEIWAFCYAKARNVPTAKAAPAVAGDLWTWIAMDAETKLIPSWFVGGRDAEHASAFLHDLSGRLANRVQLTSDGHKAYLDAVADTMQDNVDYAMLVKIYGDPISEPSFRKRYSTGECVGTKKQAVVGNPDPKHISTSFVERQNLTLRMSSRRFTRLTNAYSKKAENHVHGVSMHFMFYNFGRIHKTLRITPAMAAGVTDHVWSLEEIAALDVQEAAAKRGPYRKRAA